MQLFIAKFIRRCWYGVAILLVAIALLISAVRGLMPLADQYRHELADLMMQTNGMQLEIGKLGASWQGLGPVLVLHDVSVLASSETLSTLVMRQVQLQINVWESLYQQSLVFGDIDFVGVEGVFDTRELGTGNYETQTTELDALLKLFFQQLAQFSVVESRLTLIAPDGKPKKLNIAHLLWRNKGNRHLAEGQAYFVDDEPGNSVRFVVDATGEWDKPQQIEAQLFIEADKLNVATWLKRVAAKPVDIQQGRVNFSLWASVKSGELVSAIMQLKPGKLAWKRAGQQQQFAIESGILQLEAAGEQWQLDSYNLQFSTNNTPWKPFSFQLFGNQQQINGAVEHLQLETLLPVLSLPKQLPVALQHYLFNARPSGDIDSIRFSYQHQLRLEAELHDISSGRWQQIPAVKDLDLQISLAGDQGDLQLGLQGATLDFAEGFKKPFQLLSDHNRVSWKVEPDKVRLFSDNLMLSLEKLELLTQFELQLPTKQSRLQSPFLSLYAEINLPDVSDAEYFFPRQAMSADLVDYLASALRSGSVENSRLLWFGEFEQFPYQHHNGVFQCEVKVRDAEFMFYPGWPALTELALDLNFINEGLFMHSSSANLYGAKALKLNADFKQLSADAVLEIDAEVAGPGSEVARYLSDSPLTGVAKTFEQLKIEKPVTGAFSLTIPLNEQPTHAVGNVVFNNNEIRLQEPPLILSDASGVMQFDNEKIWADRIRGTSHGLPVTLNFSGDAVNQDDYQLQMRLAGKWPLSKVHQLALSPSIEQLTGRFDWFADFNLMLKHKGQSDFNLALQSNLKQVRSLLPAPFTKPVGSEWPLKVTLNGNDSVLGLTAQIEHRLAYHANYAHQTDSPPEMVASWLHIGDKPNIELTDKSVLSLSLPKLELDPWLAFMANDEQDKKTALLAPLPFDEINAEVADFHLYHQLFSDFKFQYLQQTSAQTVTADSKQLSATIQIPNDVKLPIQADIQRARLPDLDWSNGSEHPEAPDKRIESNGVIDYDYLYPLLSRLSLFCADCTIKQYQLGQVELVLKPAADGRGVETDKLRVDMGHSSIEGGLSWRQFQGNGRSHFAGKVTSRAADKLLPAIGYPSPLKDTSIDADLDIMWLHSPFELHPATLTGSVSVNAGEGAVIEVSDKGARLLTLASLDTVWRRLRLDFSDVFQKGLFYNSIIGQFQFIDGVMQTKKLEMDAVAGKMRGSGEINFSEEQMQLYFNFYPDVASSLPVIAAFAITPVTGVAVLALSKLLEPVIEVVTELKFELSGPLNNPKLTEIERKSSKVDVSSKLKSKQKGKKWESDR